MNRYLSLTSYHFYLFFFLIFRTYPLFATQQLEDIFNLSIEELAHIEVNVASKTNEQIQTAPSSVTVFKRSLIEKLGIRDIESLLKLVPGFSVTRSVDGTQSRISVRGRNTSSSESILILLDGLRINTLYTGSSTRVFPQIQLDNVERVEVIRGPGSALYGSHAFLGVVNIVTGVKTNEARVSVGNHVQRSASLLFSGVTDSLQWHGFIKHFADNGFTYNNIETSPGEFQQTKDPRDGFDINGEIKFNNQSIRLQHARRRYFDFLVFRTLGNGTNHRDSYLSSIQWQSQWQLLDQLSLSLNATYHEDKFSEILVLKGFPVPSLQEIHSGPSIETRYYTFSTETQYQYKRHLFNFGFSHEQQAFTEVGMQANFDFLNQQWFDEITFLSNPNTNFVPNKKRRIDSFYLQDKFSINPQFTLFSGIRWDNYNDFGSSTNPRVGLIYHANSTTQLKFLYGKAFRAPTFVELFNKNVPTRIGNENLMPEEIKTTEFALHHQFTHGQANVTYFYNELDNEIILGEERPELPENPFSARQFVQSEKAFTTSGVELDFDLFLFANSHIKVNYTHMMDTTDHFPTNFGSIMFDYHFGPLHTNVHTIFQDQVTSLPSQGSIWLWNANIEYPLNNMSFKLSIENLFDKQYYNASSSITSGVPNRPRSVVLQYHYYF